MVIDGFVDGKKDETRKYIWDIHCFDYYGKPICSLEEVLINFWDDSDKTTGLKARCHKGKIKRNGEVVANIMIDDYECGPITLWVLLEKYLGTYKVKNITGNSTMCAPSDKIREYRISKEKSIDIKSVVNTPVWKNSLEQSSIWKNFLSKLNSLVQGLFQ